MFEAMDIVLKFLIRSLLLHKDLNKMIIFHFFIISDFPYKLVVRIRALIIFWGVALLYQVPPWLVYWPQLLLGSFFSFYLIISLNLKFLIYLSFSHKRLNLSGSKGLLSWMRLPGTLACDHTYFIKSPILWYQNQLSVQYVHLSIAYWHLSALWPSIRNPTPWPKLPIG